MFDDGKGPVIMFAGSFFFFTPAHAKSLLVINLERASLEIFPLSSFLFSRSQNSLELCKLCLKRRVSNIFSPLKSGNERTQRAEQSKSRNVLFAAPASENKGTVFNV